MKRWFFGMLLALLSVAPARAVEPEPIGRIRTLEGEGSILRDGASLPAALGLTLHRGDVIRTGKPGALGIVLNDETTVSLGSGSELALVDYAFAPKESRFALVLRMAKGTFSYVAGLIGKLAPSTIQVQLPDATIGVRGTKLLITIEE
jgi:hypothetical protein